MQITKQHIRELFRDELAETCFQDGTNKTYYPASWCYGSGAGDAMTSDYYDCRHAMAARATYALLMAEFPGDECADGLPEYELEDVHTQADAVAAIHHAVAACVAV